MLLALIVPLLLLVFWHVATTAAMDPPDPARRRRSAEYMVDFAVGGIWDDAFSATLHLHLLASMSASMAASRWPRWSRCRSAC